MPTATGEWGPPQFWGTGEDGWGLMGWSGYGLAFFTMLVAWLILNLSPISHGQFSHSKLENFEAPHGSSHTSTQEIFIVVISFLPSPSKAGSWKLANITWIVVQYGPQNNTRLGAVQYEHCFRYIFKMCTYGCCYSNVSTGSDSCYSWHQCDRSFWQLAPCVPDVRKRGSVFQT